MHQPYSVVAGWLSKFHTWSGFIQALWLVAVPVTVLGAAWILMRGLRDLIRPTRHGRGHLIYGVYQDAQGHWVVYRHGGPPQEIARQALPLELIGRENVTGCVFHGPE